MVADINGVRRDQKDMVIKEKFGAISANRRIIREIASNKRWLRIAD